MRIRLIALAALCGAALATAPDGHGDLLPATAGRQFLAFDTAGDGTAVEVVGHLPTARRITVLVPGTDNTLATFDRGLGGFTHRAPAVQARVLYGAAHRREPRTAVVAWLGYDPPEGFGPAALRWDRAEAGAAELVRFVAEVCRRQPEATVVVVGHSYGALVTGRAAPELADCVTDLVALGAPGMGASHVDGLGTGARVWSATADGDWIRWVPQVRLAGFGHGTSPAAPSFGARPLPAERVDGHDGYLRPGSDTLGALADLVAADPDRSDTAAVAALSAVAAVAR
ncbi:alpha/beta hydrolase [Micromonospora sp. NBC_01813]|uniref:alpha/beta hydrolase n=1 Tax=Micromonospora sp. NBC_01813 TaxID=2975988 RepID=UPI002DDC270D|nr:alpha/beta hydrolase [Micromonospora sp. NBC_01813]WSA09928.1 alpha/beta hydrolase family protein [Micromonospora sp. NBC_01813]